MMLIYIELQNYNKSKIVFAGTATIFFSTSPDSSWVTTNPNDASCCGFVMKWRLASNCLWITLFFLYLIPIDKMMSI